jgi:hypothetical protein
MTTTLDLEVFEIVTQPPTFLDHAIAQFARSFPAGLVRAGVEPNLERGFVLDSSYRGHDMSASRGVRGGGSLVRRVDLGLRTIQKATAGVASWPSLALIKAGSARSIMN